MKEIYDHLLTYIDNPNSIAEEDYQNLIQINEKYDIQSSKERFNHFIGLFGQYITIIFVNATFYAKLSELFSSNN